MNNKFFTFFKPVFDYIDEGKIFRKPFSWLYGIFAVAHLIFPLYVLVQLIKYFEFLDGKGIFGGSLIWIVIAVAGWFSFQLWWDRMFKVANLTKDNEEFVATPLVSHLIQTFGEWFGCYVGGVGCIACLLMFLFGMGNMPGMESIPYMKQMGVAGVVGMPIYGFLMLVFFRFIAEMARALASIANNTKK